MTKIVTLIVPPTAALRTQEPVIPASKGRLFIIGRRAAARAWRSPSSNRARWRTLSLPGGWTPLAWSVEEVSSHSSLLALDATFLPAGNLRSNKG